MDFKKYEKNVVPFLEENYSNLTNIKVGNSKTALKGFLENEQSSINSYMRGLTKEILRDAENFFIENFGLEKGEQLNATYRSKISQPNVSVIQFEFTNDLDTTSNEFKNLPISERVHLRVEEGNSKSKGNPFDAAMISAGVAGTIATFATLPIDRIGLLQGATIVGITVIVVFGITYTIVNMMNSEGEKVQSNVTQPMVSSTQLPQNEKREVIDKASLNLLLKTRHLEIKQILTSFISDAKHKFDITLT